MMIVFEYQNEFTINITQNITQLLLVIKCYLLYWLILTNTTVIILLSAIYTTLDLYTVVLMNNKLYPLSWFIVIVITLISSIVIINSINYLSLVDSYSFTFYIVLFQLAMISFVLSHDIIIVSFYWDALGLISYLPINFWSSKVNCGIKAVLYNKVGDSFSLFFATLFLAPLSIISYYPELTFNILLPFYTFIIVTNCYFTTFNILYLIWVSFSPLLICYSKSAQLPFSSVLS